MAKYLSRRARRPFDCEEPDKYVVGGQEGMDYPLCLDKNKCRPIFTGEEALIYPW